ncbi:hypothetical protein [Paenibacillus sp. UNC496MF]|uniref:hypothetical protein n=1 Tax=Paenibacillus sp. UNC496MF TaxID=1502753 RepID=UPI000B88F8B1|nr:hypothetical protein [Paenibacillus sp. UNC496MF]
MAQLLDIGTSQNASYGFSISIPLTGGIPTSIGSVNLNVTGGEFIRVQLSGIAGVEISTPLPPDTVISIAIVRGTTVNDLIVAYAVYPVGADNSNVQVVTIEASDYNVPLPPSNELQYTLFLFCSVDCTRIGMESFNAVAYSN